ncbi:hypothetical protein R1sor_022982 [Riccia sorocarpa]|uniref:Cation/H+ exchanger transmembrane domain-containing protein n=1 Tax=Riccia sorocarpa TaxID=122646 RepID=A0ABD3GN58_9MARC
MNGGSGTRKNFILSYLPGIRMNHTFSVQEDDHPVAAYVASLSILVQLFMLGFTFMIGHVLRRNKISIIPEAGAALLVVVDVQRPFFGNFGAICTFAFLGTLISTFAVGTLIYMFGCLNWTHSMPFLVCVTFGALISATDPVTVLAVFNELGVDANLYAYVFGESVLNDAVSLDFDYAYICFLNVMLLSECRVSSYLEVTNACLLDVCAQVAIVMYRTVLSFVGNEISRGDILAAFSYFIANFIGSFSIGSLCAIGSALLVKYGHLNDHGLGVLESCLMVLFPYAAYMMADALELSGIVSILFTGIAMKHYTAPLMSSVAQTITTNFFQMLAKLSETFVYVP